MLHVCPRAAGTYLFKKAPLLCLTIRVLCQRMKYRVQLAKMLLHDMSKGVLWVHLLIQQKARLREMLCCPLNQGIWPVRQIVHKKLNNWGPNYHLADAIHLPATPQSMLLRHPDRGNRQKRILCWGLTNISSPPVQRIQGMRRRNSKSLVRGFSSFFPPF